MLKSLNFILLLLISQPIFAQDIPDFSALYIVKINGLQAGELSQNLSTNDDGSRQFKSATQAKGIFALFKPDLVEETSIWQSYDNFIRPQSYLYQRTGGKKEKYLSLSFDWPSQQVYIDDKKHPWQLAIEPNTLDKLVYQLALMSDLADQQTQFSYRIADDGKLKTYDIQILDTEVIKGKLGKIETVKLIRKRDHAKGRQTTLWCAPALNFLPVKLEHIEKDGSVFTAELHRLEGIATENAFEAIKAKTTNAGIITP